MMKTQRPGGEPEAKLLILESLEQLEGVDNNGRHVHGEPSHVPSCELELEIRLLQEAGQISGVYPVTENSQVGV